MDNGDWDWIWLASIAQNQKNAEKNKQNASLDELRHKAGEYKILAENAENENERKKNEALSKYYLGEYRRKAAQIEVQREKEKKFSGSFWQLASHSSSR
ncbi:MAG TPA: hypothetical protein DCZ41_04190 [Firmicutes bacterium]|nr:hypothetical protein [Bacillota bacterium]